jgi:hypothetical protein
VTTLRAIPFCALVILTVDWGTIAPEGSATVPFKVAVVTASCAKARPGPLANAASTNMITLQ